MKIGLLLGRQNEREIYRRIEQDQREKNRKQIEMIKAYRIEQKKRLLELAKAERRRELVDAGFLPPDNF